MEAALPPPSMEAAPPPALALHPKSLRQIGNLWFSERTNSGSTDEPLMRGSFFCGERGGDRSIGEANLRKGAALQWLAHLAPVRGAALSMAGGPAAPFNGSGIVYSIRWNALCSLSSLRACKGKGAPSERRTRF